MDERSIPSPAGNALHAVEEPDDLPGLYIHIPFCIRKCAYCGFYSTTDRSLIPAFRSAIRREMDLYRGWAASFDTLYLGGGTPSALPAADIEGVIADIRVAFTITSDAEITVEVNPGDITPPLLKSLHRSGVNRLNIGVQSFDDGSLALLGRRHTALQAIGAIHRARDASFGNIGLDLIYGLPSSPAGWANGDMMPHRVPIYSHLTAWLATLDTAIGLDPDHLSCYQLTLEEETPLAERCRHGELILPDESRQADFFLRTAEILEKKGYIHYEVSNFAHPGRESRHNRKYWNHVPYLGFGPAAHSFSGRERRWNRSSVDAYIGDLESGRSPVESREILSDEQLRLEALFLGFRTRRGICLETFKIRYGRNLLADKRDMIERLSGEGLVEIRDGFLRPTRAGMAVADSLALI
ncbi:MAG: radical SAM family heme chaperone HemW [Deltaproteobacteria bacterium]|nr:radical SAM family heme chaperone HemW [Deltaproteobacteria bacterium]